MNAEEAETAYRAVKSKLDTRHISQEEFNRRVAELRYQDYNGTWWAISPVDGSWLWWDGRAWMGRSVQQHQAVTQQPVQQGLPYPDPSSGPPGQSQMSVPQAPTATYQQTAPYPAPVKSSSVISAIRHDWIGFISVIMGVIAFYSYPYLAGILAVVLGGYSVYAVRKKTGRIAFIAIAGIIIGLSAMIVDSYYFVLFPPQKVTF
jgi:hypothetical protein